MSGDDVPDEGLPPGYELLDPLDQATVAHLVARGVDLRRGRHVRHILVLPSARAAEGATRSAETAGWQVSASGPDTGDGPWRVTCEKHDHVLLARQIHADAQFFASLARTGGGEHEGWEASVDPDS